MGIYVVYTVTWKREVALRENNRMLPLIILSIFLVPDTRPAHSADQYSAIFAELGNLPDSGDATINPQSPEGSQARCPGSITLNKDAGRRNIPRRRFNDQSIRRYSQPTDK